MSRVIELTKKLIACDSITPTDGGCQNIIAPILMDLGFNIEYLNIGDVKNFWARRGNEGPLVVLLGHTDVVPIGKIEDWKFDPFIATTSDGYLYGRGAADMKGGIAALLVACENFLQKHPITSGSIGFIITSDEEGGATNGTVKVVEHLKQHNVKIDYCLVGEPTAKEAVGDGVKIGRRGSITGELKVIGKQGHVAHPHRANNPIHKFIPLMHDILNIEWDKGNQNFPATSLQISNIFSGTGASNVIPSDLKCIFNLRYSNELSPEMIIKKITDLVDSYSLEYTLSWHNSGNPFISTVGNLLDCVKDSIFEVTSLVPLVTTDGGTSDARFVITTGAQIVELGLCNATIHGVNECVKLDDLDTLALIYEKILEKLLL